MQTVAIISPSTNLLTERGSSAGICVHTWIVLNIQKTGLD